MRPATFCRALLLALEASEGRRRKRKRDQTPDTIGLGIKRALLEDAIAADPDPGAFEGWMLERCLDAAGTASVGATRAMALEIFHDWQLATRSPFFTAWLERGAPSEDGGPEMAPQPPNARSAPA